jgi:hypothetical protein
LAQCLCESVHLILCSLSLYGRVPSWEPGDMLNTRGTSINWTLLDPTKGKRPDKVVWVSVFKINASWTLRGADYVGVGGKGNSIGNRYERVGNWIKQGKPIWMPMICLPAEEPISFTDGRHRFAWARDHGVTSLPVQVPPKEARAIGAMFGTEVHVSEWIDPRDRRKRA